jgi:hypothetical protein
MVAAELLKASEGAHFPDDGEAYSHRMVLYRVYGDEAGETHLREIELPELELNAEGVEKLRGLLNIPAISVGIVQLLKPTPSQDLHPAPERRLLVFLSGETEITTTTGDRQVLGAGDCLLADDVGSKGHYTCDIGPEPRTMVTVGIPRAWQVPDL